MQLVVEYMPWKEVWVRLEMVFEFGSGPMVQNQLISNLEAQALILALGEHQELILM